MLFGQLTIKSHQNYSTSSLIVCRFDEFSFALSFYSCCLTRIRTPNPICRAPRQQLEKYNISASKNILTRATERKLDFENR